MTSIYLVRHGQASFAKQNYDQLSELGETQARILGQALAQRIARFDKVFLGTMHRHKQTAVNCLDSFEVPFESHNTTYDAGLNEYDHQEILAKLRPEVTTIPEIMTYVAEHDNPKEAFRNYFSAAVARWMSSEHDADYSESWSDFTQRVHGTMKRIVAEKASANNIIVFTSGGPISVITQALLEVPQEKMMQMNWTLLNCGVTKLVATQSGLFVSSTNEHTHFEGEQRKSLITYT